MVEKPAMAQDGPTSAPTTSQCVPNPQTPCTLSGRLFTLSGESPEVQANAVFRGTSIPMPLISVEGPADLSVRLYPILRDPSIQTRQYEVRYSIDNGAETSVTSTARVTAMTVSGIDLTGQAIGRPETVRVRLGPGRHQVSFTYPQGFLEVVGLARVVEPPPRPPPVQPPAPQTRAAGAQSRPAAAPARERRPFVTLDSERTWLHSLGSMENSGDINLVQPMVYAWLNDSFAIVATAMFSSYGLALDTESAQAKFRNYSGDLGAGLAYRNGEHLVYGLGFAGYRAMVTDTLSLADGRFTSDLSHFFEYGGQAAYRWGDHLGVRVTGSNNPFNPLSVRAWGVIPYTWAGHSYPFIEADMLWLHAMTPLESATSVGGARLDESNFHIRGIAGVPIYPIGPLTPYALLGGEMEASGAGVRNGSFIWGGLLRLSLMQSLDIEAGVATNLQWAPIALLRMSYSR
jgi:hypothetical protein